MTGGAILSEYNFTAGHHFLILRDESLPAGSVLETERLQPRKKLTDVPKFLLGSQPINRIFLCGRDFERLLRSQPNQHIVLLQEVLRVTADVDIDAERRPYDTDRVSPIFQNVRYRHRDGFSVFIDRITDDRQQQRLARQFL